MSSVKLVQIPAFWKVTMWEVAKANQTFRRNCCLPLQIYPEDIGGRFLRNNYMASNCIRTSKKSELL